MLKPKPTVDRPATQEELSSIESTEKMLAVEKTLPSSLNMARGLAVEQWRSLKLFLRGKRVICESHKAQHRWRICKDCPALLYDETNPDTNKKDGRCVECGCFMNVKVHYESAECPKDKW